MAQKRQWESLIGGRDSDAHDDELIEWVERMLIRRMPRDRIVKASIDGKCGWPATRADGTTRKPLSPTKLFAIRAVIAYKERKAGRGVDREQRDFATQIAASKRMEREAGLSSRAFFIKERTKILELGMHALRIRPMVYWSKESVPDSELEDVYDRAVATLDALRRLVAAIDTQRGGKQLRDKIKALRAKADSTLELGNAEEADSFYRKAAELEDRLDHPDDNEQDEAA
jgi:hypothetical protein